MTPSAPLYTSTVCPQQGPPNPLRSRSRCSRRGGSSQGGAPIKPLLSRSTAGEFNSLPHYLRTVSTQGRGKCVGAVGLFGRCRRPWASALTN
eukprot:167222-Prorocentrum_minimum.AAC.2